MSNGVSSISTATASYMRVAHEGEREGARCRYGVMNVCETMIMNRVHVWSLVRPVWELVCRLYLLLTEKLVHIARSEYMHVGVQMRVRLERIKRVVDVVFDV
jgi:hypothetical protein